MRKPVAVAIHPGRLVIRNSGAPGVQARGADVMYVVCDDGAVFNQLLEEGRDRWNPLEPIPGTEAASTEAASRS